MSKSTTIKLKNKLKQELQVIKTIEVLKQIAVQEFQFMENQRKEACRFTKDLESFFQFYRSRKVDGIGLFESPSRVPAIVAVTSDEGFTGSLNRQIIDEAAKFCKTYPDAHVVAIGRRGARQLIDIGIQVQREFPGIELPLEHQQTLPLKNYLMREHLRGRIGMAEVIFAKCDSFTRQTLAVEELLPFSSLNLDAVPEDPRFEPGLVILEPEAKSIIEYTIGLWFGRKLYEIFWDSKLSEVAARAIELNERSEKLSKTNEKTRIRFFRAQHEVIDQGIREVFSGQFFAKKLKKGHALAHG